MIVQAGEEAGEIVTVVAGIPGMLCGRIGILEIIGRVNRDDIKFPVSEFFEQIWFEDFSKVCALKIRSEILTCILNRGGIYINRGHLCTFRISRHTYYPRSAADFEESFSVQIQGCNEPAKKLAAEEESRVKYAFSYGDIKITKPRAPIAF